MSARFQGPLVDSASGRVKLALGAAGVVPADAIPYRGMIISPAGSVYGVLDTGQARVFQDGIAIEESTGQVIFSTNAIANIAMGGLAVDAAGAVVYLDGAPDLIHQGVGLKEDGRLGVGFDQGAIIPDGSWTIDDPAICTVSNNVITWNRVAADSFISLAVPPSLSAGQTWVLSYEVLEESGQGSAEFSLFIDPASCVRPSAQVGTIGSLSYEVVATLTTHLIRWTPTAVFNGVTLQIADVRLYDKNDPGAYP